MDIDELWERITELSGQTLKTYSGLEFDYTVKGHEIFISRKNKSITYSSVNKTLLELEKLGGVVPGPKALGVFGASYIYPIFVELGIIDN